MTTAAIDFNDAAIALVTADGVVRLEDGYACLADGELLFGAEARNRSRLRSHETSNRHWRELGEKPLPRPIGRCRTSADLVEAHLAHLREALPPETGAVVAAVPSYWNQHQLGLLLAIARESGFPLRGFVDSAVAASRRPYPGRVLWNLELTLHDAGLTRMAQDSQASRATEQRVDWLSMELLNRACARSVAAAFLRSSRFDPFDDAESEQDLYGRLPGWLAAFRGRESLTLNAAFRGHEFVAMVRASDVRTAVAQALEKLVQRLRSLVAAGDAAILQVPDRLADYPGALEALAGVANCRVVTLEPGAVAAGALRLRPSEATDAVRLVMNLPWNRPPAEPEEGTVAPVMPAAVASPTHIVHGGRAYRLGSVEFQLGSEVGDGQFGLRLPASLEALSRRHCGVRIENGRALVHDYSRYGTRLNGQQIEGSAVLHSGDVIQIGRPAVELMLVAEVPNGGTPA